MYEFPANIRILHCTCPNDSFFFLIEITEGSTTVSDTDVLAVLNDLTKILKRHLDNGEIVRFGDFGTFQAGLTSEGAETEEKF